MGGVGVAGLDEMIGFKGPVAANGGGGKLSPKLRMSVSLQSKAGSRSAMLNKHD